MAALFHEVKFSSRLNMTHTSYIGNWGPFHTCGIGNTLLPDKNFHSTQKWPQKNKFRPNENYDIGHRIKYVQVTETLSNN